MPQHADFTLPLSIEEAWLLVGALERTVEAWRQHYDEDDGRTHKPEELEAFRVEPGTLIWRLEELALLPGQSVEHSPYAVRPPDDEDGGAGVREPRFPKSPAPTAEERRE